MLPKDFLLISDLTAEGIRLLVSNAENIRKTEGWNTRLSGKTLTLLFEKPSIRHRVSFEVAMVQLGGHHRYLAGAEVGQGQRESVGDVANVLSRYTDCIAARTFSHQTLEEFTRYSRVPAHRGEEVTDEIMDGPQSVVFEQSENKMHLLKALLAEILGGLEMPLPDYG